MSLPDRRREDGFSLVELVVVTMMLGIVSLLVTGFVINVWRDSRMVTGRVNDIDQGRIAMDAATKALRTAVTPALLQPGCDHTSVCTSPASADSAVSAASDNSVTFYANTGAAAGPTRVTYTAAYDVSRATAVLTELRQPPDSGSAPNFTYPSCTVGLSGCTITSLPRLVGLAAPAAPGAAAAAPIFRYYDTSGALLVGGTGGVLSAAQLAVVGSIEITLPVQTRISARLGSSTLVTRVYLPNSSQP